MPRKLIKKYMPNEDKLKQHKHLSWLGSHIHEPNLWHLNRKSVSRAFLVGLFCAFLPIPMQMIVAAILAIMIRSNLPISVGLVWITNPLTMPPIFYFTYLVGDFLIGDPNQQIDFEMSMDFIQNSLSLVWWPLLFGSVICGVVFGILGYLTVQGFWAWHVGKSWKDRAKRTK